MRVSAGLPTGMEGLTYPIPFSDPENVIRIAQAAEKFGYDSVWGNDHMTTQNYVRAEFPVPPRFWEPLITYAFVLSETKTIKVGTGVIVLPMRHDIVVSAKQIATLDHFGKGRLEIGVGIGAYREEFKALQPDAKMDRGDIVDEGLQALNLLFKERVASFDGKYYKFRDVELYPKPLQKHIPIYVGGNNPNNIIRTVKWADGWLPAGMHVDRVRAGVKMLREEAEKAGRDPKTIEVCPQFVVHVGKTRQAAVESFRKSQMNKHLVSLAKSTLKGQGTADARGHQPDRHAGRDRRQGQRLPRGRRHPSARPLLRGQLGAGADRPDADLRRRGHAEGEGLSLAGPRSDRALRLRAGRSRAALGMTGAATRHLREPFHLVLELGHAVGRDHQGAGVVDADLPEAVDLLEDQVGRADQVGHDLLGEVAAGIGERLAVRDQARFHVAALRLLGRLRDGHRELRRDLDLRRIAAELGGARLQDLDALLELGPRAPAGQPAGGKPRGAFDGLHVVPADPQRERDRPWAWDTSRRRARRSTCRHASPAAR